MVLYVEAKEGSALFGVHVEVEPRHVVQEVAATSRRLRGDGLSRVSGGGCRRQLGVFAFFVLIRARARGWGKRGWWHVAGFGCVQAAARLVHGLKQLNLRVGCGRKGGWFKGGGGVRRGEVVRGAS